MFLTGGPPVRNGYSVAKNPESMERILQSLSKFNSEQTYLRSTSMKLPSVTQAFILHFAISLAVFCVLVAVMVMFWFPGNLFFMEGGWEGLKIIAPIDLVLGPALTLVFYRPWKKNVKFDMSVIVALQVAALGYGVFTALNQRTAAIVFAEHRFETLSYNEFKAAQKETEAKGLPTKSIEELGGKMPILVYAEPFEGAAYKEYLEGILNDGDPELRERSDRYRVLSSSLTDKLEKYRITGTPSEHADSSITEIPASSKPSDESEETNELRFPLVARYSKGEIVLDPKTYEIIRITREE